MAQRLLPMLTALDHAERAEQAGRVIKRLIAQRIQFDEVRAQQRDRDARLPSFLGRSAQHFMGKIDTDS